MKLKARSAFKEPAKDLAWFRNWVDRLAQHNQKTYSFIELQTSLGKTHVWTLNPEEREKAPLVIFPGARTTALIWDFANQLDILSETHRLYLVETNGLPNLSDGNTPDIKGLGYGHWVGEVLDGLGLEQVAMAGASFGGLVAMKFAMVAPERIKVLLLLNSAGLRTFSFHWKNLYLNLLPIISTTEKNVSRFLNEAVFFPPTHQLSEAFFQMLVDYEVFAIQRYKDRTQKPYYLGKALSEVQAKTYLFQGTEDRLFPTESVLRNARKYLPNLADVFLFEGVGHGIETEEAVLRKMQEVLVGDR